MQHDVVGLRDFYSRPLGGIVRRLLTQRIRTRWRSARGRELVGLGFAVPYIGMFRDDAARLAALMPAHQGALVWPHSGNVLSVLVDEVMLPLPDSSVDLLLCVHCLEVAESTGAMLREIWRVLAPGGRVLLVVPNRRSIWSQLDTTPFGQGRPYSRGQIARLLRDALFTPVEWVHALYVPPFNWPLLLRWAIAWERMGAILWPAFSGVILVEATKQVYAITPQHDLAKARRRLSPAAARAATARSYPREGR